MSTLGKKITSAAVISAVVFSTVVTGANGVNAAFTNVEAANKLANMNVIVDQSTNPASYRLADTIQRQEALKIMMKLSDKTVSEEACTSPFADIADSDWACKYAVAALAAGFIAENDNYRPSDKVSKIEALKMVMQARGIAKSDATDWRSGYVEAGVEAGITSAFSDYNTASERGSVFVFAANAIDPVVTEDESSDDASDLIGSILDGLDDDDSMDDSMDDDSMDDDSMDDSMDDDSMDSVVVSGDDNLTVSLNPETPSDGLAQRNTARVALLTFDVKAGSQDVTLNQTTLDFIGLGDYNLLEDVSIYNSKGEKVSKTKSFKEIEREITFDKNIVVEAGKTMTLTVAGKLTATAGSNATYGIKLTNIEASSDVAGDSLVGALLVPADFANVAALEVSASYQSGNITIGDTETLVEFDIEEKNDNEDVIVKTITLHLPSTSTADEEDFSNLTLYIEGEEYETNLTVNSDEEIVMAVNYNLEANEKVTFEVKGSISGSVGDDVDFAFESNDDVYAIGATSGMPVALHAGQDLTGNSEDLSDARLVEGSEINVSFEKGDKDEARPDAEGIVAGTLKLLALTNNYEVTRLDVIVTSTTNNVDDLIENVELGGVSEDGISGASTNSATFTFEDIALNANEEEMLELTFDVLDNNALNGDKLNFQVVIMEVNDDIEDKDYTSSTTPSLSSILSSTALDTKDIDIETGSITVTNIEVTDKDLVIGNGVETVLYKAKISIGDADTVTINDFNLIQASAHTVTENLDKVIDSVTLNIGGQTFDGDIDSNSVDFTGISASIEAGSDNIEVLVTAVLKDNDSVSNNEVISMELDTVDLDVDDSDGDTLDPSSVITTSANTKLTTTILKSEGTFEFAIITNGDNKDDIDSVVLAGTSDVTLAEFKMEADLEDIKVNSLKLKIPATINGAVAGGSTITPTTATSVSGVTAVSPGTETTTLTVSTIATFAGNIQVNVNGVTYSAAIDPSVQTTDALIAVEIADSIAVGGDYTADAPDLVQVTGNVVTVAAASGNTSYTDASVNDGGTNAVVDVAVTTQGAVGNAATPEQKTVTFPRAFATGDSVTVNGIAAATPTTAEIGVLLAADASVVSTSVVGTVVTLVGAADGSTVNVLGIVATPYAPIAGTVSGDYSDTLTNVRLMNGSSVIADNGVVTYDTVNNESIVEFEDFTVTDSEDEIEGTIVADIRSFTTNGNETSAELGNIIISAFTVPVNLAAVTDSASEADVEGVSSDNVILSTVHSNASNTNSDSISVVPVIVTAAIADVFNEGDTTSEITFTIDKGNNVLDNDDIRITDIQFETGDAAYLDNNAIRNDDGSPMVNTDDTTTVNITTLNSIIDGDKFTLTQDTTGAVPSYRQVIIVENGITFSINNAGTYSSSNEEIMDLGSYKD